MVFAGIFRIVVLERSPRGAKIKPVVPAILTSHFRRSNLSVSWVVVIVKLYDRFTSFEIKTQFLCTSPPRTILMTHYYRCVLYIYKYNFYESVTYFITFRDKAPTRNTVKPYFIVFVQ